MPEKERQDLIEQAVKGDTHAFAELYSEIYKELYYFALSNLGDPTEAEDAVSDTILDAFQGIKKLKKAGSFSSWIFTILNAKIKKHKKHFAELRLSDGEEPLETMAASGSEYQNIEIYCDLAQLSDEERQCITLSCICGYKGEEIAQITGINPSTVRSHISRARTKIKKLNAEQIY
ncbi:MAG: RNA polymerase sigma factor [Ruminococcus sp.]|nr:RNA polymerase sigma factor [Ruminococcus sp.]